MKINIFQWRYSPFLILLPLLLPTGNAQAALSVTCEADMNTVNFGTITGTNANNASTTGTLNYSCTNNGDTAGYVSVCLAADGGQYTNTNVNTRYIERSGSGTDASRRLNFTMTLPGGVLWSTRGKTGSEYNSDSLGIPANSTVTGIVPINVAMKTGNGSATQGVYTNNFNLGHTALTFLTSTTSPAPDCNGRRVAQQEGRFPFIVQAAIEPSCSISATSNVDLGTRSASETNITGSNSSAITVNCTNGGSYYIGLAPSSSNGIVNNDGAGFMSGTSGNTDKVPYQLFSDSNRTNKWGNTATSTSVGNGVTGIGDGGNQTHAVYVTVPSAAFKPDTYKDTVTIKVNY